MSSLVLDLQKYVLEDECDVLVALRKAHVIASKLHLEEFDVWVQQELNGYKNCVIKEIPDYRTVKGSLMALDAYNGWIPAIITNNKAERLICEVKLAQSIGELQGLYKQSKDGFFVYQYNAEMMNKIASIFNEEFTAQYTLHISRHLLLSIVENVKNALLEWTIRLEFEGVIGDDMNFNQMEKESAQKIPQQVNNYYGTIINGNVCKSQIVSGNNNTNTYSNSTINDVVNEIKKSLNRESISDQDKESAVELLEEISAKLEENKKPGIIKAVFVGLKDFLIAVGADVTAALITAKIQGIF